MSEPTLDQDLIERIVHLSAPVPRVWRALTDYRQFGEWFRVHLDGPFEVGVATTGNMTLKGYEHVKWLSCTEKMEPEHLFAFSWHPGAIDEETDYDEEAKVLVEFRLEPTDKGTQLTITETGFLQFPDKKRLGILRSNIDGWDLQAENIKAHVEA